MPRVVTFSPICPGARSNPASRNSSCSSAWMRWTWHRFGASGFLRTWYRCRTLSPACTSPSTPIPASHLDVIFEICHFPPAQRDHFLAAYAKAHPARLAHSHGGTKLRRHTITLPDLGNPERNEKVDELVADFVRKLSRIINEKP